MSQSVMQNKNKQTNKEDGCYLQGQGHSEGLKVNCFDNIF